MARLAKDDESSVGKLHLELLEQLAPPSVIVNQRHELLHLSEHAGRFLQLSGGEPSSNLLRLVHPMLRLELRAALFRASQTNAVVESRDIPVEMGNESKLINLRVAPLASGSNTVFLVVFDELMTVAGLERHHRPTVSPEQEPAVRQLEQELEGAKAQLRDTIEQSDASAEELKASNEELQAMNEELRSTGEELETGREELQSINEELSTINQELKSKVEELGRSNSDLANLMAATQIATIFLDRDLRIQRYTPPAVALFSLIPTDVGRPIADLKPRLQYSTLVEDSSQVLATLSPVEVEVEHPDGRYFLSRMLPYRTTEDHISGVVLTFVDITQRRRVEADLRASEERFRAVADLVPDLLFNTDPSGRLQWCNQRWFTYTGQTVEQAQGFGWVETIAPGGPDLGAAEFPEVDRGGRALPQRAPPHKCGGRAAVVSRAGRAAAGRDREDHPVVRGQDGRRGLQALGGETGGVRGAAAVDHRQRAGVCDFFQRPRVARHELERRCRANCWGTARRRSSARAGRSFSPRKIEPPASPRRKRGRPRHRARDGRALAPAQGRQRLLGQRGDDAHERRGRQPVGLVKILRDQTESRQTREALEESRQNLLMALAETERAHKEAESASRAKDHFLAVLSHELRTPLTPVLMGVSMLRLNRELPGSAREALDMIERNVRIEALFIDDLLDITRISRGKLEIVREPTDVHEAIQNALQVTAPDSAGQGTRRHGEARRPGAPGHRGLHAAPAALLEPAQERRQVHPDRRVHPHQHAQQAGTDRDRDSGFRHRLRCQRGGADFRGVRAGQPEHHSRVWRAGAWTGHRQGHGGRPWGQAAGGKRRAWTAARCSPWNCRWGPDQHTDFRVNAKFWRLVAIKTQFVSGRPTICLS